MLWLETFCFYCSVRLGVIVSASFSLFNAIVLIVVINIYGTSVLTSAKHFIEKNELQNQEAFIVKTIDEVSARPLTYIIVCNIFNGVCMGTSTIAIYGAVKLQKLCLIPYIMTHFVVFCMITAQHIIAMMVLKKVVNLGILIGLTLAGGFYILYLGYSWVGAVALFQIIVLVNSKKYKGLYGDDPMEPKEIKNILSQRSAIDNVNNMKIYSSIILSELKRKRLMDEQQQWQYGGKVVPVIPLEQQEKEDNVELIHFNNWHLNELVGMKKGYK